jgi:ABC-type lipopolysaccharide export system ATPase subunit
MTRAWMKNYNVVAALTRNPKTPVALSMNLLARLTEKDLRMLSTDRNVPDVLRVSARKKLVLNKG